MLAILRAARGKKAKTIANVFEELSFASRPVDSATSFDAVVEPTGRPLRGAV